MPGYEDEIKLFDTAWETRISTCSFPADMCMAMVDIRDIINNCNDALSGAGLAGISYSVDAGYQELIRITNNIVTLNDYITRVRADLGSAIDDPLFYAFNQKGKATELLSLIHMEDFQTANTVNVGTITSYDGNIATTTKSTIGFSDFIGSGGAVNPAAPVTQKVCVQEFNDLFAQTYEDNKKYGNLSAYDVKSLKDYQNLLLTNTEFDHKKEQPFRDFLSGAVDILIIPQFLKAAVGYDPITDEDLTDQERDMLVLSGCIQIVLLGIGVESELMAKAATVEGGAIAGGDVLIRGDAVAGGSVQHAVGTASQAQSVLDGINPKYFNIESRFGGGFYVCGDSDTIIAELAEHGNTAKYAISYDMNLTGQKVLDLTNPQVASNWDFVQNLTSTNSCQDIGAAAKLQGYNVIKFQSFRSDGINYVIYNNFDDIVVPRIVSPVE